MGHPAGIDGQPLDDLFDRLGDAVECKRKRLDVLALERGHKRAAELLRHLVPDALFLAAGLDEVVEIRGRAAGAERVQVAGEQIDTRFGLLRPGFQEVEKLVLFAEYFLKP